MAMHQLQHRITTTLQRNMPVWHESSALGTIVYQFIAQQVGLHTTDTIALHTLHSIQRLYQVHKAFACRLAKVTNVHTRQHNFLGTLTDSLLGLRHQRGYRWITAEATGIRNRAIGAEIVTAVLYLQEIARPISS